jgi:(E)-4-hydroxy-3-methyl-but-2-enyl pyrophosphate reductase
MRRGGRPVPYLTAMGNVREVRIARRTGFCYGVREAIDKAKEAAASGKRTHTLGQVVHNEGVIHQLSAQGIATVESLDDVRQGAAVVIRAHGVRPDVLTRAEDRGLEVIDGTCTWVIQEQREITRLVEEGYSIVLLGTPRHPEVVGLLGFAPDAIVVDEEEDWDQIPRRKKMALISQSTQPPWKFEKLAAFMVSRCHELKIVNTVCPVTIRRQEDTVETAREVDLMVVVGGRSSANTKELTRLCGIVGTPAIQIESEADLTDASIFGRAAVVGVTGGTSTPIEDLRCVAERILRLAGTFQASSHAEELANAALAAAATPAGRTTSLPAFVR